MNEGDGSKESQVRIFTLVSLISLSLQHTANRYISHQISGFTLIFFSFGFGGAFWSIVRFSSLGPEFSR